MKHIRTALLLIALLLPLGAAASKYIDRHRSELKSAYSDFEAFRKGFTVPAAVTDSIFSQGEAKKIKPADDSERTKTATLTAKLIKAIVARDLWDTSEYFRIINDDDATIEVLGK